MNLYLVLRGRGFAAPFAADERCRGSVRDAAGKLAPTFLLPGPLTDRERRDAAEMIADLLNAQAQQFEGRRLAA